jgi:carbon monoxide dehydrogenase subunit G
MRIETTIVIKRPIDEVWAFLLDPFNRPRASDAWLAVRQTSPGQTGLGSTYQGRIMMLGFEKRIVGEITEWNPPHTVTLSAKVAGLRGFLRGRLEAVADGTRVTRVTELESRPATRILWWILGPWWARKARAADQRMRQLLESDRG